MSIVLGLFILACGIAIGVIIGGWSVGRALERQADKDAEWLHRLGEVMSKQQTSSGGSR